MLTGHPAFSIRPHQVNPLPGKSSVLLRFGGVLVVDEALESLHPNPKQGSKLLTSFQTAVLPFKEDIHALPDSVKVVLRPAIQGDHRNMDATADRQTLAMTYVTANGEVVQEMRSVGGPLHSYALKTSPNDDVQEYWEASAESLQKYLTGFLGQIAFLGARNDDLTSGQTPHTVLNNRYWVTQSVLNNRMFSSCGNEEAALKGHYNGILKALKAREEELGRLPEGAYVRVSSSSYGWCDKDVMELVLEEPFVKERHVYPLHAYNVFEEENDRSNDVEYVCEDLDSEVATGVRNALTVFQQHFPNQLLAPLKAC